MLLQAVPHPDNYSHTISKHLEANTGYKIWRSFWHILWHSFRHSIWHLFWHTFWIFLAYKLCWHSFWHSIWHLFWHSFCSHWDLALAVEARQCPLTSGARRWGPAVPTEMELAVEVRQCPLTSGAGGWGPAVPNIWSSRMRPGSAHWDLEFAAGRRRKKEGGSNSDKSGDTHLSGGEQNKTWCWMDVILLMCTFNVRVCVYCVRYIYVCIYSIFSLAIVPHKVAEVSKIGNYRRGELLWCMDGRANPLMDRKVDVISGVVAVVTSPTTAGCSVL